MSDLISRQDAIDIVNGYQENMASYIGTPNDSEEYAYARGLLLSIDRNIKSLPSAQPQRKKGHWIRHPEQRNIFNGKTIECSECHEKYTVQYVEDELFCRHCGADMREPEDIPMEYFESGGR